MNKALNMVFHYHNSTKHSQQRYARSLGYMDWATQPNPFREYNLPALRLPLAVEYSTPPYHLLDESLPCAPLCKESISQLLQFSMGIAAWKSSGDSLWAVRCNASSGNLHPTEAYLLLPPLLQEQNNQSALYHYMPKSHALEELASFRSDFWETLPKGSFLLGLSTIVWREAWKYGERAFRYANLDAGHAWQSLSISAKMLGWKLTRLYSVDDEAIDRLLGLNQTNRFVESEEADMLFIISPQELEDDICVETLLEDLPHSYSGIANRLSPSMQEWEIIDSIKEATKNISLLSPNRAPTQSIKRAPTQESKAVVLGRRSVHVMDKERSLITQEQFHALLTSVAHSLTQRENSIHLLLFVHRVEGYKSGLYILVRNSAHREILQEEMASSFRWQECPFDSLYLLDEKDFRSISKAISCSQDIASDGAFSVGMLAEFSEHLREFGAHSYKELYFESGAIGQQLYLEASSMGLSGTGIGCFLDDMFHELLALKSDRYQSLYHFTLGRGFVDSRIMTHRAYKE